MKKTSLVSIIFILLQFTSAITIFYSPYLIQSLLLNIFRLVCLLTNSLFLCGRLTSRKEYDFKEIILLSALLSGLSAIVIYVSLIVFLGIIDRNIYTVAILVWSVFQVALFRFNFPVIKINSESIMDNLCFFVCVGLGILFVSNFIPQDFWRGWDPWVYTPISKVIVSEFLSPSELLDRLGLTVNVNISGFFYLISATYTYAGLEFYDIIHFGAIIITCTATALMYLILKNSFGSASGMLASFTFIFNAFLINRFSMTLRENYSYLFLLGLILVLSKKNRNNDISQTTLIGLLLSGLLITHPLTFVLGFLLVSVKMVYEYIYNDFKSVQFISILLSLLIGVPFLKILYSDLVYMITNSEIFYLSIVSLIVFTALVLIKVSNKFKERFQYLNKWICIILLISGAYAFTINNNINTYSIFTSIQKYFSIFFLFVSIFGLIKTYDKSPLIIKLFTLIILGALNLTYIKSILPISRLIIYLQIPITYYTVMLFKEIHQLKLSNHLDISLSLKIINIPYIKNSNMYLPIKLSSIIIFMIFILFSPLIYFDYTNIKSKSVSYDVHQIDYDGLVELLDLVSDKDMIVCDRIVALALYAGIDPNQIVGQQIIRDYINTQTDSDSLVYTLKSFYPNAYNIYYYKIRRYSPYPDLQSVYTTISSNYEDLGNLVIECYRIRIRY